MSAILEDERYEIDRVYGSSAGAILAPYVANRQLPKLQERIKTMTKAKVFESWYWRRLDWLMNALGALLWQGAFRATKVRQMFAEDFEHLKDPYSKCSCVAWNARGCRGGWFTGENYVHGVEASIAIPCVVPPKCWGGEYWWDGGVVEPVPFTKALRQEEENPFDGTYLFVSASPPVSRTRSEVASRGQNRFLPLREALTISNGRLAEAGLKYFKARLQQLNKDCVEIYPNEDLGAGVLDFTAETTSRLFRRGLERGLEVRESGLLK
jgi:predicted acylesterase/phospholipase RssA